MHIGCIMRGSLVLLTCVYLLLLSACIAHVVVPTTVEIRLIGLEGKVNLDAFQQSIDALSTTDVQLFPNIQLVISYKVRFYDSKLSPADFRSAKQEEDGLVNADNVDLKIFQHHEPFHGFAIYILNIANYTKSTAYASDPMSGDDDYCATQVWSSTRDRFAWIDLSAIDPPSDYGPLLNGEGYVSFGRAIPPPGHFSRSSFHARLATLCHRAALHLGSPSTYTAGPFALPFTHENSIVRTYIITSSLTDQDTNALKERWDKKLTAPLKLAATKLNENLKFETVILPIGSCPICAAAHELAINVKERTDILDPVALRNVLLKKFPSTSDENAERVFNIFVFRTDLGPLLFDGSRQVVAFSDSVVAIEATSSEVSIPTNFQCRTEGRAVTSDASDVTRQVLAKALQSIFGVPPTFERYSTALGRFAKDYLFAVGHTPFGPFSRSIELTKGLLDVCWKNPVLAHVAKSLNLIYDARSKIEVHKFHKRAELISLIERAENAAKKSAVFVGLLDADHAKEFAEDCRVLSDEISRLVAELNFQYECVSIEADGDGSGGDSFLTSFKVSIVPILLIFMSCAVLYETRITRVRTFIQRFQGQRGVSKNIAFVSPAKKVD